jgi:hypothetical protein
MQQINGSTRFNAINGFLQSPVPYRLRLGFPPSDLQIQNLDANREGHGEVGVTFRNVKADAFSN